MNTLPKNMFLRNGMYYFRFVYSFDGKRSEAKGSLKTRDLSEAVRKFKNEIEPIYSPHNFAFKAGVFARQQSEEVMMLRNQVTQLKTQAITPAVPHITNPSEIASLAKYIKEIKETLATNGNGVKKSFMPIAEAVAQFQHEKTSTGQWRPTIARKHAYTFNEFLALIDGTLPVTDFTRKSANEYIANLRALPTRWQIRFKGKSIQEIISQPTNKRESNTIRNIVVLIKSMFHWLKVQREEIDKNPFDDLLPRKNGGVNRREWTVEELKLIFSQHFPQQWQYWLPRIAIYSGMRLEEITQLYIKDIVTYNGVLCFDINNSDDKKLKNDSAVRLVPIHSELIKNGFMNYVQSRKAANMIYLWDFPRTHYGLVDAPSNWFGEFKKSLGFGKRTVFHSFRANTSQALKNSYVDERIAKQIIGHTPKGVTETAYSKQGYAIDVLQGALEKIRFDI